MAYKSFDTDAQRLSFASLRSSPPVAGQLQRWIRYAPSSSSWNSSVRGACGCRCNALHRLEENSVLGQLGIFRYLCGFPACRVDRNMEESAMGNDPRTRLLSSSNRECRGLIQVHGPRIAGPHFYESGLRASGRKCLCHCDESVPRSAASLGTTWSATLTGRSTGTHSGGPGNTRERCPRPPRRGVTGCCGFVCSGTHS
jgi:hypothetical protein